MRRDEAHIAQAGELARLRRLREDQALRARSLAAGVRDAAQQACLARQAQIEAHRRARDELAQALCANPELLRWAAHAKARRELIEDRLERAEYALLDDQEALADAERRLADAGAAWRRAHARHDAACDLLREACRSAQRAAEHRAESEDPHSAIPLARSTP